MGWNNTWLNFILLFFDYSFMTYIYIAYVIEKGALRNIFSKFSFKSVVLSYRIFNGELPTLFFAMSFPEKSI